MYHFLNCSRYSDADDGPKFDPVFVGCINMIGYFTMFIGIGKFFPLFIIVSC